MTGYWERPEATAETIREGWLLTGDLGHFDAEGFVTLDGRSKELFISGGENVYPRQVEAVYEQHPALREVAVVGVPDPRWGEVGLRVRRAAAGRGARAAELARFGRERLAAFKVPQRFVAVAELPRTASGKVQKHRARREPATSAPERLGERRHHALGAVRRQAGIHRQAEQLARRALGVREAAGAEAEIREGRLEVQRPRVDHRRADALLAQRRGHALALGHAHRVDVPDVPAARRLERRLEAELRAAAPGSAPRSRAAPRSRP